MALNLALELAIFFFLKAREGRLLRLAVDWRWHGLRAVLVVAGMILVRQLRVLRARE